MQLQLFEQKPAGYSLIDFLHKYDQPGTIILLEGKRNVLEKDKEAWVALGKLLGQKKKHLRFRSGNADGADLYFSKGIHASAPADLEVITPYTSHRQKDNVAAKTYALDNLRILESDSIVYQSKFDKPMDNLIDAYMKGNKNKQSIKAAYILRDTVKVLGHGDIPAASFGIFYDDLTAPMQGGTGHTMKVCKRNHIPYIDQRIWMNWLS